MGKAFTDEENKKNIVKLLIEGRRLATECGFRKTSVEELIKLCNISKGQFYRYFESKEAFFWRVREEVENEIHGIIKLKFSEKTVVTKEMIIDEFYELFCLIREPKYKVFFDYNEVSYLTDHLSGDEAAADFDRDIRLVKELILQTACGTDLTDYDYELITGVVRSAFLVASSENLIGKYVIDGVCRYYAEFMVEFVHQKISEAAKKNEITRKS